jgi:hypothetical protein
MATKLVGADDITATGNEGKNYFFLNKFTAVASGTMTEFRVKSAVAGNVKCALYADSGGEPGALIIAMNTGQAVTGSGWQTLSFTPTSITNGVAYWLAICIDTAGAVTYKAGGGTYRYKVATYSTFTFPNPAGSGFTNYDGYDIEAGWETATAKTSSDTGSGADAYVSLVIVEAKSSSDIGSGVDSTPLQTAAIAGSETGSSIDAIIARLLASFDTGYGIEVGSVEVGGLLKALFASELGWGSDSLTAKIEMPTKGGGMKLWT